MAKPRWGHVLRGVRSLLDEGVVAAVSDGELLERYATSSGESAERAFAALVDRHGPMVLRVCRSVLGDEHAAQDAFQATFLILARRRVRSGSETRSARGSTGWPTGLPRARGMPRPVGGSTSARPRSGHREKPAPSRPTNWRRSSTRRWIASPTAIDPRSCSATWRA